jgi:hypothetical protein
VRLRNEALRKAKKAVKTGPKRKRLMDDKPQFIRLIGVYERDNHQLPELGIQNCLGKQREN